MQLEIKTVQYDELSSLTNKELTLVKQIRVVLDKNKPETLLTTLFVSPEKYSDTGDILEYKFSREEEYASLKEFSTLSMKELLVLFSKRSSINNYPDNFTKDDPKLHSFLSKLSYSGIEFVAKNIKEFSKQFKDNKLVLKIPRPTKSNSTKTTV